MNQSDLHTILSALQSGQASLEQTLDRLQEANGFIRTPSATIDTGREVRCGIPEVIYCESKSPEQIIEIARVLYNRHGLAFGTRCSAEKGEAVCSAIPEADYHPLSRTLRVGQVMPARTTVTTGIIAAGTSDLPVAEEAARTLETFGGLVNRITDVGVAGVHRLFAHRDQLEGAGVLIVVAGMEGALPSVVGGMVRQPVIAVPTSIGYGTALGGFTPLFGMLTSCASGVTVVNIDNGFGAAAAALRILDSMGEQK